MTLVMARGLKLFLLLIVSLVYALCYHYYAGQYTLLISGVTLVLILALLMSLSVIRQLPFFSLCNARFWAQTHLYVGLFGLIVFILHTDHSWPHGVFNTILFVMFLLVVITGVVGIYIYRQVPKKIIYFNQDYAPMSVKEHYADIREQAELALKEALAIEDCRELQNFYLEHLYNFFNGPKHIIKNIVGLADQQKEWLLRELMRLQRYAAVAEDTCLQRLQDLLQQKSALDYYHAQKLVLRCWLAVHVPVAYVLILLVITHIVTVAIHFRGVL